MSRKILDDKGKIEGYDGKEPITGSIGKIQQIKKMMDFRSLLN